MAVVIEYTISVAIDNIRSIFLLDNILVSQCMKHIELFHHFIWDYFEDRTVTIQYFCSEENRAGPSTKNLSNTPFELFTPRCLHAE